MNDCGNKTDPCKTINFALGNVVNNDDVIMLMSDSFDITQPLLIHKEKLTFKSYINSSKICCQSERPLFNVTGSDNYVNLRFEEITFVDVSLFDKGETSKLYIDVSFERCSIQGSKTFLEVDQSGSNDVGIHAAFSQSTINLTSFLFNLSSNNKANFKVDISNCRIFQGALRSNGPINLTVSNSRYNVSSFQVASIYKIIFDIEGNTLQHRANVTFSNITISGNMTGSNFFKCKRCLLSWEQVSFTDCTLRNGLVLDQTDGNIDSLSVSWCTSNLLKLESPFFIQTWMKSDVNFTGPTSILESKFYGRLIFVSTSSSIYFEELHISKSYCEERFITCLHNATLHIDNFTLSDSLSPNIEAIRLALSGKVSINQAKIHNNTLYQFVFMWNSGKSNKPTGQFVLRQAVISMNHKLAPSTRPSSFFGIVLASSFEVYNTTLTNNTGMKNIFDIRKSKVFIKDFTISGNMTGSKFFTCSVCSLSWERVYLQDCTLQYGLYLDQTDGIIDSLSVSRCTSKEKKESFIKTLKTNMNFTGLTSILESQFDERLIFVSISSSIYFEELHIVKSYCENRFITCQLNATLHIDNFTLSDSSSPNIEAVRLASSGKVSINQAKVYNNTLCQFVLMSDDDLETGQFVLRQAVISMNHKLAPSTRSSSFFGIVLASSFEVYNTTLTNNTGITNIFDIQRSNAIIKDSKLVENTCDSSIKAILSNIIVENVVLLDNLASGYGKALIYEGDICQSYNITIRNLHARIIDHANFKERSEIFSINIKNSSLIIDNVTIDIQPMQYPIIAVVFLKFATLNKNVLHKEWIKGDFAYKLKCPPSYYPYLKSGKQRNFYSESYECLPCFQGSYSMERISADLLYVNNTDIDVKRWENTDIIFRNRTVAPNCKVCPQGGNCTYGIRSRGNYFGLTNKGVRFLPCPPLYCCSNEPGSKPCKKINTCNYNRVGLLCGKCESGYFQDFLTPICISNSECTTDRQIEFWIYYSVTALLFTLAILFFRDVCCAFKKLMSFIMRIFKTDEEKERKDKKSPFILSHVIQISIGFFQMMSMVQFNVTPSDTLFRVMRTLNLQVVLSKASKICPFKSMDAVWKNVIDNLFFMGAMLLFLLLIALVYFILLKVIDFCRTNIRDEEYEDIDGNTNENLNFKEKLILCLVRIYIYGYKNISLFTIISLNCVEMNGKFWMYLSGNVKCYQPWQWAVVGLLVFWVIPFPAALVYSYKMFDKGTIDKPIFLLCLSFPFLVLFFVNKDRKTKSIFVEKRTGFKAVLYGVYEEPFRSISTNEDGIVKTMYWWTAWRLYERLLIAVLVTFLIEPLFRMCVIAPVVVVLLMLHYHLKPYKEHLSLLSWLDISSYAFLLFYVVDNLFHSFIYIFDIPIEIQMAKNLKLLEVFKIGMTPLTVILGFLVALIISWICSKVYRDK